MEKRKTINDSRLIDLLKALTGREMRSLSEFVASPFFNKKEKVTRLFEYVKKRYPGFRAIYRTDLYQYVFQKKTNKQALDNTQYANLRYAMSDLVKLVQEYLLHEELKKNEVRQKHQLATVFLERGLQKHVPDLLKTAKEKHALRPQGDPLHLYDMSQLAEAELFHSLTLDWGKPIGMQAALDHFHHHALAGQLRLYAAALSREHTMPFTYNYLMEKELLEHFSENDYTHVPIVDAYYRMFMLFKGEDIATHYARLLEMLTTESDLFSEDEQQNLYPLLFNFCNLQINLGLVEYHVQKFELYEYTLPKGLWHYGKYISRDHFILAIRTALETGNIQGANAVIEQYGDELQPQHKKPILHLSRVYVLFAQKKYVEAQDALIKMGNPPEGFYYGIYFRLIKIKVYYELSISQKEGYINLLESEIENLRGYLKRAPMSKRNKASYKRFLRIITRIYSKRFERVKAPSAKILQSIKDDINNPDELLVERLWLLEKIEEVEVFWNKAVSRRQVSC